MVAMNNTTEMRPSSSAGGFACILLKGFWNEQWPGLFAAPWIQRSFAQSCSTTHNAISFSTKPQLYHMKDHTSFSTPLRQINQVPPIGSLENPIQHTSYTLYSSGNQWPDSNLRLTRLRTLLDDPDPQ